MSTLSSTPIDRVRGGAPAIVTWTVFLLVAVSGAVFVWALATRSGSNAEQDPHSGPVDPPREWASILLRRDADLAMFRRTMEMKYGEDSETFQAAIDSTLTHMGETLDLADTYLAPVRNADGSIPPEYEGYQASLAPLRQRVIDLARASSFKPAVVSQQPTDH